MHERKLLLRDRIIGVLLRDARRRAGWSRAECAEALGASPDAFKAYEEGRAPVSLPELEVLGYLLNTPITHFVRRDSELKSRPDDLDFGAILNVRHRLIGALMRQARLEAGLSQEDLAELLNCTTERISDYERGRQAVPLAELELLAPHLEVSLEHFMDDGRGTVGGWHRQRELDSRFHDLPAELQAFVADLDNKPYLKLAMTLSQLSASTLRELAEVMLEIPR